MINHRSFHPMNRTSITIRLFAGAREAVQSEAVQIELDLPSHVGQLKKKIAESFSALIPFVENGRIAIANEFVNDEYSLSMDVANWTIALIPPVSGG